MSNQVIIEKGEKTTEKTLNKVMKYKVYTKWIGYSEIIVDAENEQEAKDFVSMGSYAPSEELLTGNGLDYGYEDEQVYKVEEFSDE